VEITEKIFFIGSGNMSQAIIKGILEAKLVKAENIICNDISKEKLSNIQQKFGVSVVQDKNVAIMRTDIVFIAVKPQNMLEVCNEIKKIVQTKTLIISIAAGITTKFIEDSIQKNVSVVRAMSNTPAFVCSAATALCKGKFVSYDQFQKARNLFSSIGKVEMLPENRFDIITALSGSGPAYIFYFCELMQKAAEKLGLDREIAKIFAVQTVYGSAKMLDITGEPAEVLKEKVKSPNGTTEMALKYFEFQNLPNIVYKAMEQAMKKSRELTK